ncbi:MAG: phage holin family protein [Candidatus Sulfotelmatobacter sp.]
MLAEFKDEAKDFAATRLAMLQSEMREKIVIAGTALQAIAVGAAIALLAAFFLCVALVALVAMSLGGSAGAWAAAFAIVGFAFLLIGGLAIAFGIRRLKARGLKPERTLHILKQDQIWLQSEARNKQ